MNWILIPALVILMIMVVVSLGRGIVAFLQSTREDLERPEGAGPSASQLRQNKMMYARIMYQGIAVLVVALLLFANR